MAAVFLQVHSCQEGHDKTLVKQFIARCSKSLRATGKERDIEKFLQQFLLDEHYGIIRIGPSADRNAFRYAV